MRRQEAEIASMPLREFQHRKRLTVDHFRGGKYLPEVLSTIADDVPADAKAKIDAVKAGLKDGSFSIWKGPITGQDGKELIAADKVADDGFLKGINFYVKGVEGKVPGGDAK